MIDGFRLAPGDAASGDETRSSGGVCSRDGGVREGYVAAKTGGFG